MKESRTPLLIAIALLLLPLLYVGSYFTLVRPGLLISYGNMPPARYRWGGQFAETVFWPMEQIDRRVRLDAWAYAEGAWE